MVTATSEHCKEASRKVLDVLLLFSGHFVSICPSFLPGTVFFLMIMRCSFCVFFLKKTNLTYVQIKNKQKICIAYLWMLTLRCSVSQWNVAIPREHMPKSFTSHHLFFFWRSGGIIVLIVLPNFCNDLPHKLIIRLVICLHRWVRLSEASKQDPKLTCFDQKIHSYI